MLQDCSGLCFTSSTSLSGSPDATGHSGLSLSLDFFRSSRLSFFSGHTSFFQLCSKILLNSQSTHSITKSHRSITMKSWCFCRECGFKQLTGGKFCESCGFVMKTTASASDVSPDTDNQNLTSNDHEAVSGEAGLSTLQPAALDIHASPTSHLTMTAHMPRIAQQMRSAATITNFPSTPHAGRRTLSFQTPKRHLNIAPYRTPRSSSQRHEGPAAKSVSTSWPAFIQIYTQNIVPVDRESFDHDSLATESVEQFEYKKAIMLSAFAVAFPSNFLQEARELPYFCKASLLNSITKKCDLACLRSIFEAPNFRRQFLIAGFDKGSHQPIELVWDLCEQSATATMADVFENCETMGRYNNKKKLVKILYQTLQEDPNDRFAINPSDSSESVTPSALSEAIEMGSSISEDSSRAEDFLRTTKTTQTMRTAKTNQTMRTAKTTRVGNTKEDGTWTPRNSGSRKLEQQTFVVNKEACNAVTADRKKSPARFRHINEELLNWLDFPGKSSSPESGMHGPATKLLRDTVDVTQASNEDEKKHVFTDYVDLTGMQETDVSTSTERMIKQASHSPPPPDALGSFQGHESTRDDAQQAKLATSQKHEKSSGNPASMMSKLRNKTRMRHSRKTRPTSRQDRTFIRKAAKAVAPMHMRTRSMGKGDDNGFQE